MLLSKEEKSQQTMILNQYAFQMTNLFKDKRAKTFKQQLDQNHISDEIVWRCVNKIYTALGESLTQYNNSCFLLPATFYLYLSLCLHKTCVRARVFFYSNRSIFFLCYAHLLHAYGSFPI